jgi:hypothetical protein
VMAAQMFEFADEGFCQAQVPLQRCISLRDLFNEAHRGKSPQCYLVFAVLKVLTHVPQSLPPVPTSIKQQRCVGSTSSSECPIGDIVKCCVSETGASLLK